MKKKRILSLFIALTMLLSIMPTMTVNANPTVAIQVMVRTMNTSVADDMWGTDNQATPWLSQLITVPATGGTFTANVPIAPGTGQPVPNSIVGLSIRSQHANFVQHRETGVTVTNPAGSVAPDPHFNDAIVSLTSVSVNGTAIPLSALTGEDLAAGGFGMVSPLEHSCANDTVFECWQIDDAEVDTGTATCLPVVTQPRVNVGIWNSFHTASNRLTPAAANTAAVAGVGPTLRANAANAAITAVTVAFTVSFPETGTPPCTTHTFGTAPVCGTTECTTAGCTVKFKCDLTNCPLCNPDAGDFEWVKVWGLDAPLAVAETQGAGHRHVTVGGNRAGFRTESSNVNNYLTLTGNTVNQVRESGNTGNLLIHTNGSNWSPQAGFAPVNGVRYRVTFDVATTSATADAGIRVAVGRRSATGITEVIWSRSATGNTNATRISATSTAFTYEFTWGVWCETAEKPAGLVNGDAVAADILNASVIAIISNATNGNLSFSNMKIDAWLEEGACLHENTTTVAATCVAAGSRSCDAADCTWTETIAALGHNWNVTTAATCTTAGVRACTRTGCTPAAADLVIAIDPAAHTYEGAAPHCGKTCTQTGCTNVFKCTDAACAICNECTVCANGATFPTAACCTCGRLNAACENADCANTLCPNAAVPTLVWTVNPAPQPGVARVGGTPAQIMQLSNPAITAAAVPVTGVELRVTLAERFNVRSTNRALFVWTDLSGTAEEVLSTAIINEANLTSGKVAQANGFSVAPGATMTVEIPRSLLVDGTDVAKTIYVAFRQNTGEAPPFVGGTNIGAANREAHGLTAADAAILTEFDLWNTVRLFLPCVTHTFAGAEATRECGVECTADGCTAKWRCEREACEDCNPVGACEHCATGGTIAPPVVEANATNWTNGNRVHTNAEGAPVAGRSDLVLDVLDLIKGTRIKPSDIFGFNMTATHLEGTETIIALFSVNAGAHAEEGAEEGGVEEVARSPEFRSPNPNNIEDPDRIWIPRIAAVAPSTRTTRNITYVNGLTAGDAGAAIQPTNPAAFVTDNDIEVYSVTLYTHTAAPQRFRVDTVSLIGANGVVLGTSTFNTETNTWSTFQSEGACVECTHGKCDHSPCEDCIAACTHATRRTNIIREPTCMLAGEQQEVCATPGCPHTFGAATPIAVLAHTLGEPVAGTAATCLTPGSNTRSCTVTGCTHSEPVVVPALGHNFGGWNPQEVTQANCMQAFTQTRTCLRDGCTVNDTRQAPATGCGTTGCTTCGGQTCSGVRANCPFNGCGVCEIVDLTCTGAGCTNASCNPIAGCSRFVDRTCGGAACTNPNCTPGANCARVASCTPTSPCGTCATCQALGCQNCNNCTTCGFNGGKFGLGRVTNGNSRPDINDALAVLRSIIGLPSVFDANSPTRADALIAGNITQRGTARTSVDINDALEILRFIIGLPTNTSQNWHTQYN
ncbi:MAG: hypothetical protein FWD35_02315 [Oscillospiraceae bacterium]|nr:hypothetical protein [Oscillospiraceae bacterium]